MGRKELLHRLGQMLVTLIGVTILTFGLTYIAPGDAVDAILETGDTLVSAEVVEQTRHELGLDQPFHIQYLNWLTGLLHGDMGISYSAKMPVVDRMLLGAPGTLALTGVAIVMMLVVSVPAGIAAAVYRNSFIDYLSTEGEPIELMRSLIMTQSDRDNLKQDFTPRSLAYFLTGISVTGKERKILDVCAGSGALTYQASLLNPSAEYTCIEYDEKMIYALIIRIKIIKN